MTPARLKIETAILEQNFAGQFAFIALKDPYRARLEVRLRSSTGKRYGLEIVLGKQFPATVPTVFIVYPDKLYTFRGEDLVRISPSHPMHTLQTEKGAIQLCHYKKENWHENVTLYKVILKCLLWIEAYESHLQSGRPLTDYLGN